ncbi:MAG: alpha/beta fold hydrolase [Candidatus Woesearchaeota archaeon]
MKKKRGKDKLTEHHEEKHKEHKIKKKHKHRKLFVLIIVLLIIVLSFFGTKGYLYFNFLIGNDIIVKLDVSQESFELQHGQEGILTIKSSVTTNPFCSATCTSKIEDLSNNKLLLEESFELNPASPYKKELSFNSTELMGYYLYRVDLSCQSISTTLCHTSGKPTTRNILITVKYDLNENEEERLNELDLELVNSYQNLQKVINIKNNVKNNSNLSVIEIETDINQIQGQLKKISELLTVKKINQIDLTNINNQIVILTEKSQTILNQVNQDLISYNNFIDILENSSLKLKSMGEFIVSDPQIDLLIDEFNNISNNNTLTANEVYLLINKTNELYTQLAKENTLSLINKENQLNLLSGLVCGENCFPETNFQNNVNTCEKVDLFLDVYGNYILNETIENETILNNTLKELNLTFDEKNFSFSEIIEPCQFNSIGNITLPEKKEFTLFKKESNFILPDKKALCCLWGECNICQEQPAVPIVFLHGHAIDKDTSFEYSLEGFNKIQNKMEKDGIINAGAITLYTTKESQGLLGKFGTVSIKGSYYFDIFEEPENYYVVQTKSENIDTYAIRLKEVIDTITYKTGSPKIKLVAFSMGGLVARRYLQVFGDDQVEKFVTIGTPHQGIEGEISNLCTLTGEERECQDMDKNSLFMNKLNRGSLPKIPFEIIVGSGCTMDLGDGDGAVLLENAKLNGVKTVVINGKCRGKTEPLHLDLLNIEMYPQVYEEVMKFLKD